MMSGMTLLQANPRPWLGACSVAESIGDSMGRTLLAIVAVDVVGAGAGLVGVLNSAGMVAFLLLGVPLGLWVDRVGRPAGFMTVGTLVRAALALSALLAWWAGVLHSAVGVVLLVGVALGVGVADVAFTTGQGVLIPALVPQVDVRRLYGLVQTWTRTGSVIGTLCLPLALAVVAPPAVWLLVGMAYLASVLIQRGIKVPESAAETRSDGLRPSLWHRMRSGTGHLLREPTLRRITAANMLVNAAVMCANTLVPVIALTVLDLEPSVYALVGIGGALAGIAGAALSHRLGECLGLRAARLLAALAMAVGAALVMCCGVVVDWLPGNAAVWLTINSALAGFFTSLAVVLGADLVPALTPSRKLGVVLGAQRTLVLGSMPVAALLTGALSGLVGTANTTWLWLLLLVASVLPILRLNR